MEHACGFDRSQFTAMRGRRIGAVGTELRTYDLSQALPGTIRSISSRNLVRLVVFA